MTGTALAQSFSRGDSRKLQLFSKTVGKDLRGAEIDEAVEWCEIYGANPFVKDIFFFVMDAQKASRHVVPVLSIGLYRKIAKRTGCYRPDEKPARFTYDEALKGPANPKGIVSCELSIFIFEHGAWFPVTESIRWEERAPVKERWQDDKPTGTFYLDPKKKNWHTMPETMLAKTVEAAAIRKAFPEQTSGSYAEGEMDQAEVLNLTATEILETEESKRRLHAIGGANCLTVDWCDGQPLQRVPVGKFGDAVIAFVKANQEEGAAVLTWADRNRHTLREYWALDSNGALEVKKVLEPFEAMRPKKAG